MGGVAFVVLVLGVLSAGVGGLKVEWCANGCGHHGDINAFCGRDGECVCGAGYDHPTFLIQPQQQWVSARVCTRGGSKVGSAQVGLVFDLKTGYHAEARSALEQALSVKFDTVRFSGDLMATLVTVPLSKLALLSVAADDLLANVTGVGGVTVVAGNKGNCVPEAGAGVPGIRIEGGCLPLPSTPVSTSWCTAECLSCQHGVCEACPPGYSHPPPHAGQTAHICARNGTDEVREGLLVFEWSGGNGSSAGVLPLLSQALAVPMAAAWHRKMSTLVSLGVRVNATSRVLLEVQRKVEEGVLHSALAEVGGEHGHLDAVRLIADSRGDCFSPNATLSVDLFGVCTAIQCQTGFVLNDTQCRAPATAAPHTPPPASLTDETSGDNTGLPTWLIVVIALSGLSCLVLILALFFCLRAARQGARQQELDIPTFKKDEPPAEA